MRRFAAVMGTALILTLLPASAASAGTPDDDLTPREPGPHSVVYRQQAVIAADQGRVWQLLVDLPGYASWNPWVVRAEGSSTPGSRSRSTSSSGPMCWPPSTPVLVVEPQTRFCWRDAGWNAIFVYGQRCRTLQRQPDGTILVRNELLLDGIFSPAADLTVGKAMRERHAPPKSPPSSGTRSSKLVV